MDRRALEYFRAVAEHGSISAAAANLYVTQPAVSKQIKRLEEKLAIRLFHRASSGMALTAAGEELFNLGNDLLARFERTESTLHSRYGDEPSFRVACPSTTAYVLIAPFMADCAPNISDLTIVPTDSVDGLLDREVDLAISTNRPPPHRRQKVVGKLPITVQAPPNVMRQRYGDSEGGDLERLSADLLLVPVTGVHFVVDEATAKFDSAPRTRAVAMGFVAQALAATGHGVALATEQPAFGLERLHAKAGGELLWVDLYASWDVQHYGAADLESIADSFSQWLAVTPPWGKPGTVSSG